MSSNQIETRSNKHLRIKHSNKKQLNTELSELPSLNSACLVKSDERLYFQSECKNSVVEILNENKVIVYNIAVTDVHESFRLQHNR